MKRRNSRLDIYFYARSLLVDLMISVPLRQVASQSDEWDVSRVSRQINSGKLVADRRHLADRRCRP